MVGAAWPLCWPVSQAAPYYSQKRGMANVPAAWGVDDDKGLAWGGSQRGAARASACAARALTGVTGGTSSGTGCGGAACSVQ